MVTFEPFKFQIPPELKESKNRSKNFKIAHCMIRVERNVAVSQLNNMVRCAHILCLLGTLKMILNRFQNCCSINFIT